MFDKHIANRQSGLMSRQSGRMETFGGSLVLIDRFINLRKQFKYFTRQRRLP